MAVSIVQKKQTPAGANSSLTYPAQATVGNLMVVFVSQTNTLLAPSATGWTFDTAEGHHATQQGGAGSLYLGTKVAGVFETGIILTPGTGGTLQGVTWFELADCSATIDALVKVDMSASKVFSTSPALSTAAGNVVLAALGLSNAVIETVGAWSGTGPMANTETAVTRIIGGSLVAGAPLVGATFTANWTPSRTSCMLVVALRAAGTTYTDAATATGASSGLVEAESLTGEDADAGTSTSTASSTEASVGTDANAGTSTSTGSSIESWEPASSGTLYIDAEAGSTTSTGSSTETGGGVDEGEAAASSSGTGVDDLTGVDKAFVTQIGTGSRVEALEHSGTGSGTTASSGSVSEEWSTPAEFDDWENGTTTSTGSMVDEWSGENAASASSTSTGSAHDELVYSDASAHGTLSDGDAVDETQIAHTASGTSHSTGSALDELDYTDANEAGTSTHGTGVDVWMIGGLDRAEIVITSLPAARIRITSLPAARIKISEVA